MILPKRFPSAGTVHTETEWYRRCEIATFGANWLCGPKLMAFHPRQNSMLHFTFYFSHFILHLLFDIRVYSFVIQLSSCNIQVFALYIHLFVHNIQVHVQVQRVALSSFRIQCLAFANQVFAFNI